MKRFNGPSLRFRFVRALETARVFARTWQIPTLKCNPSRPWEKYKEMLPLESERAGEIIAALRRAEPTKNRRLFALWEKGLSIGPSTCASFSQAEIASFEQLKLAYQMAYTYKLPDALLLYAMELNVLASTPSERSIAYHLSKEALEIAKRILEENPELSGDLQSRLEGVINIQWILTWHWG